MLQVIADDGSLAAGMLSETGGKALVQLGAAQLRHCREGRVKHERVPEVQSLAREDA